MSVCIGVSVYIALLDTILYVWLKLDVRIELYGRVCRCKRVPRACFWGSASQCTARARACVRQLPHHSHAVCVPEQGSQQQPDHDAACGRVPGPHVASISVSSGMWLTACYACGTCVWWQAVCVLQAEYASDGCEHIRWMLGLACSRKWSVCSCM